MTLDFIPSNKKETEIEELDELLRIKKDLAYRLANKFNNNLRLFITSVSRIKKERKRIAELTSFIDTIFRPTKKIPTVPMSYRVYCILNNMFTKEDLPVCEICGKVKAFHSLADGFKLTCGARKCCQNHPQTNKKRQETAIKNYGSLKAALHDKAKVSIQKKYGVDNVSELDWVKEKKKETSREHYGTDYPWQSDKGKNEQKNGVIKKHGVTNISMLDEIKEKKIITSLKNWGVENPSQCLEVRKRILQTNGKIYITPSGEKLLYEGDENIAFDYLFELYDEKFICIQPDILIPYLDSNEKKHVWFPDVSITNNKINSLIELKGLDLFTYKSHILEKIHAGNMQNFDSYVILYHKKELYKMNLINYTQNTWILKSLNGNFYDTVKKELHKYGFNII